MKKFRYLIFLFLMIGFISSCEEAVNPVPTIESMSPASKIPNMPSFYLTIKGTDFTRSSNIVFNGVFKDTTYVKNTELKTMITAEDLNNNAGFSASYLSANGTISIPVYVSNPKPGGGKSEIVYFIVRNKFTFSEHKPVAELQKDTYSPFLLCDSNNRIYMTFYFDSEDFYEICYTSTETGGESFSTKTIMNQLSKLNSDVGSPGLAIDANERLCLLWNYRRATEDTDNWHMWGLYSTEGVISFNTPLNVYQTVELINTYKMNIFGTGNLFCAWTVINEEEVGVVFFRRSTDFGENWTDIKQLNNRSCGDSNLGFEMDNTGNMFIVWNAVNKNTGREGLYYTTTSDFGDNFTTPSPILVGDSANDVLKFQKSTLGPDGRIYITWWERNMTDPEIFKLKIAKFDSTWSGYDISTIAEFDGLFTNQLPNVGLDIDDNGNLYVVTHDQNKILHFYKSTGEIDKFSEAADAQDWDMAGSFDFILDNYGSMVLIYTKEVEYEILNEDTGETEKKKIIEPFYVQTNE